jgi:hypothetical protein
MALGKTLPHANIRTSRRSRPPRRRGKGKLNTETLIADSGKVRRNSYKQR